MPDDPTPAPTPAPAKKKRAPKQEISRQTEADIRLAEACALAAAEPENAGPLLTREWTAEKQSALTNAAAFANQIASQIIASRGKSRVTTASERAARENLLAALDPIITGAKRTYPGDDNPNRRLFGIGLNLAAASTTLLYRLAGSIHSLLVPKGTPPTPEHKLTGVLPTEIQALADLTKEYKDADFAQATAQLDAGDLLTQLTLHLRDTLNPLRRELQLTADQQWPWRNPAHAPKRKAFGLPIDQPAGE